MYSPTLLEGNRLTGFWMTYRDHKRVILLGFCFLIGFETCTIASIIVNLGGHNSLESLFGSLMAITQPSNGFSHDNMSIVKEVCATHILAHFDGWSVVLTAHVKLKNLKLGCITILMMFYGVVA